MFADFFAFMFLASVSASGFFFSFYVLAERKQTALHIVWLMLKVWFGT